MKQSVDPKAANSVSNENVSSNEPADAVVVKLNDTHLRSGLRALKRVGPNGEYAFTACVLQSSNLTDGSRLQGFKFLESLDLSGNALASASFVPSLTGLKSLDMHENAIPSLESVFSADGEPLRNLTKIDLSSNKISGDVSLSALAQSAPVLKELTLNSNAVSSVNDLSLLGSLEKLAIASNALAALEVQNMTSLKELYAGMNPSLKSLSVTGTPSITRLHLRGLEALTSVGSWVQNLETLEYLNIRDSSVAEFEGGLPPSIQEISAAGSQWFKDIETRVVEDGYGLTLSRTPEAVALSLAPKLMIFNKAPITDETRELSRIIAEEDSMIQESYVNMVNALAREEANTKEAAEAQSFEATSDAAAAGVN